MEDIKILKNKNNNFEVHLLNSGKYKITPLTKEAFFEYQKFKYLINAICNLLFSANIKNISKDFYEKIDNFCKDINQYNKNYFVYDIEVSKMIIDILKFLSSDRLLDRIPADKNSKEAKSIEKNKKYFKLISNILESLNNILEITTKELEVKK